MPRSDGKQETSGRGILPRVFEDLRHWISPETHTLEQIQVSLNEDESANPEDIVPLLEKHHAYLKESIGVLAGVEASVRDRQGHLTRLIHLLKMHGQAEEETIYFQLQRSPSEKARMEGYGAQEEHTVAYQLARELKSLGYELNWTDEVGGKAKTLAGLIANHIREEEDVLLPLAQTCFDGIELKALAFDYLDRCKNYLALEILTSRAAALEH